MLDDQSNCRDGVEMNVRIDGLTEDLGAAGVVEENLLLFLLQGREMRSHRFHI